ncbi:VanZ family protein [Streptomyces sp. NPDC047725]|uniref:VanZ family protein n=1 Tax=Streptomyces sp. NPDC047725 TaxID=3365487 RepID=UPI0037110A51
MIEASIKAVPGLLLSFLVLALLLCLPTWLIARKREPTALVPVLFAASLAGAITVTLLPGNAGTAGAGTCDTGWSLQSALDSPSAWMNVALFVPAVLFAVLLFKRPVTTAAAAALSSGAIELAQTGTVTGRSCSLTDFVMNVTGVLIGVVIGSAWLRARRGGGWRCVRDLSWGAGVACVGALALTGAARSAAPETYDAAAVQHRQEAAALASEGSSEWITKAAKAVFGDQAEIQQMQEVKEGNRLVLTAFTDQGEVSAWWPEKKLIRALPQNNQADAGPVRQKEAVRIGERFAKAWFPEEIRGSELTTEVLAEEAGDQAMYQLTYRRYVDGLMMPMRLDITITSSGRIMGFTARPVPDPALPKATLNREDVEDLVRQRTATPPTAAVLLAQQVNGEWRPVWMIGMPEGSKAPDIFVDAVSGKTVKPDPL